MVFWMACSCIREHRHLDSSVKEMKRCVDIYFRGNTFLTPGNFWCELKSCKNNREVWRHKNLNLWNYVSGSHIQKEQEEKYPLAKNQPVSTNWWGYALAHTLILVRVAWTRDAFDPGQVFRRIYMESSEHNGAYIPPPLCINRLIFSKWTFFMFLFLNMLTYPIISHILWRHHFSSLLLGVS